MTVLFFSKSFYPSIGGVEKHCLEVSRKLIKKGFKVIIFTEKKEGTNSNENIEGIEVYRISVGNDSKWKKFRIWVSLFRYINKILSADIVHCHDIFFWYLPFRLIFPFKPVYTTFHGYEGNNLPSKKAIFMHKLAEKLSKGNICVGEFLHKWYGTTPTFVTYGAIDEVFLKNKNTKKSKDAVFIGRLEKETGIMEYLKALRNLKLKKINLRLDIYGDGVLKKHALDYVKKNKLKVSFKGFVGNAAEQLINYKFVFASRYLAILEAMALSKPVFAVYNNAIKKDYLEMAPFSSFISISKNAGEISLSLEDNINNNLNTKKAFEWVKDKTWDNMANIYIKLWEK